MHLEHLCTAKVRATEVGVKKVCLGEVGAAQVRPSEECISKAGLAEVRAVQPGLLEIDSAKVRPPKVRFGKRGPSQVGPEVEVFAPPLIPGLDSFLKLCEMFRIAEWAQRRPDPRRFAGSFHLVSIAPAV
jgi:hypothetical protein